MKTQSFVIPATPTTLNLDEAAAIDTICAQLRNAPPAHPQLHIDCGQLRCQRTLGVSYVVSQLLRLRKAGASVWLRNVNAPLRRCLQLLRLGPLFHFVEAE